MENMGSSPDSSLNGLKFGKKIYFEDVGIGVSAKSDDGSSSISGSKGSNLKKGRGFVQGGKLPRCQVQGCKVDLSGAKTYYSKHKVCGMHSKSPMVIVAGLEQRFCQQCSRFHQLPEFDQGKRSCRRRLAGHNERRRKPPSEPLLSSRYGRLAASLQENSSRVGSFVMDFTTYPPRLPSRDMWPIPRAGDRIPDNQHITTGKFLPHQWQGSSGNLPTNVLSQTSHQYLQDSSGVTAFSSSEIPSGECFTGVSDSSCALSLLSNQPWSPRNRNPCLIVNNLMSNEGTPMAQLTAPPHCAATNNFTINEWSFKGNEASTSSHEMLRDFGLVHQAPRQPLHLSGQLELALQGDNRAYGSSTQQMHWPL